MSPERIMVMQRVLIVGIGGYLVSNRNRDIIKTYALGSCVAATIYCPAKSILGMGHIALPDSGIDKAKGQSCPGYFADTAIPSLLRRICNGCHCNNKPLIVKLFGGAKAAWEEDAFQIGRRNLAVIEGILRFNHLPYDKSQTGGEICRTIEAEVATGKILVTLNPIKLQKVD